MDGCRDSGAAALARIGQIVRGKYCVERVLGTGGMSVVYAVTHRNQARFAMKVLTSELSRREDVRKRFLREGYAANSVSHPSVVRVVDDDTTEDGAAFLVMDLLEGKDVETLWESYDGCMPAPAALAIADQLLDGLAAAHACGIVHRDVKPANLFVTRDGVVKILDFGIARVRDLAASGVNAATGEGVLLGTPSFMAPEQAACRHDDVDERSDVWSAGATLFALLSGRLPHEGPTVQAVLVRSATERARSLRAVLPSAPEAVVRIVDRALALERDARWPTAEAMRDAVRRAYREVFGKRVSPRALLAALVEDPAPLSRDAEAGDPTLRDVLPAGVLAGGTLAMENRPRTLPMGAPMPAQARAPLPASITAPPVAGSLPPPAKRARRVSAALASAAAFVLVTGAVVAWRAAHAPEEVRAAAAGAAVGDLASR